MQYYIWAGSWGTYTTYLRAYAYVDGVYYYTGEFMSTLVISNSNGGGGGGGNDPLD
jgi:hypothetical protein